MGFFVGINSQMPTTMRACELSINSDDLAHHLFYNFVAICIVWIDRELWTICLRGLTEQKFWFLNWVSRVWGTNGWLEIEYMCIRYVYERAGFHVGLRARTVRWHRYHLLKYATDMYSANTSIPGCHEATSTDSPARIESANYRYLQPEGMSTGYVSHVTQNVTHNGVSQFVVPVRQVKSSVCRCRCEWSHWP